MTNDAYVPTIVQSTDGLAAVSLAAFDSEVMRLRRQRNVAAFLAVLAAVAAIAAVLA